MAHALRADTQDFARNTVIVYSPDGQKHQIELRSFSPRFLADISCVALSPNDSGMGSNCSGSTASSPYEKHGYFDLVSGL